MGAERGRGGSVSWKVGARKRQSGSLLPAELGPGQQRSQAGWRGPGSGPVQRQAAFKGFDLREMSALAKSGGWGVYQHAAPWESKEKAAKASAQGFVNTTQRT